MKIKVLVVEPNKAPYEKEIEDGLASLQHEVGGTIQAIYPFEEEVAIICNDEGKLEGLQPCGKSFRPRRRVFHGGRSGQGNSFLPWGLL